MGLQVEVSEGRQVVQTAEVVQSEGNLSPGDYPEWETELKGKITASQEDFTKRTNWHRKTIVGAYLESGRRNAKWDKAALALMEQWIPIVMTPDFGSAPGVKELGQAAKDLVDQGCDDPIVAYIRARYLGFDPHLSKNQLARRWKEIAAGVMDSEYPPVRQFWPLLRAASYLVHEQPMDQGLVMECYNRALACVGEMAADPETPELDLYVVASSWYSSHRQHSHGYMFSWEEVDGALNRSKERSFARNLLKGQVYTDYAWEARGSDWAYRVTQAGWEGFFKRLSEAEKALVSAWYQRPDDWRAPSYMITVELGQGRGRARMEKWFQRAMAADPYNYDAVNRKLYYLEPKWHGSEQEMLKFGRECLNSTNWFGTVPLYLIDAHSNIAGYHDNKEEYYQRPGVWDDIRDSYERYFKTYPDDYHRRSHYAKWAIRCNQPMHARKIIDTMGTNVVKSVFGNDREFEKEMAWLKMKTRSEANPKQQ